MLCVSVMHGQTYLNFTENGKWGVLDQSGKVVLAAKYSRIDNFVDGLAPTKKDGLWGLMDAQGKVVVPFLYHRLYPFYKGKEVNDERLFMAQKKSGFGLINIGNEAFTEFDYIGLAVFDSIYIGKAEDGQMYLGKLGQGRVLATGFNQLSFDGKYIQAVTDSAKMTLNRNGEVIFSGSFYRISVHQNAIITTLNSKGNVSIYTLSGELKLANKKIDSYYDNIIKLLDPITNEMLAYDLVNNKVTFKGQFNNIFHIGDFLVYTDENSCQIQDKMGNEILGGEFKGIGRIGDMVKLYKEDQSFSIYDTNFNLILGPDLDLIALQNGYYWCRKNLKYGLIRNEKVVIEPMYKQITINDNVIKAYVGNSLHIYTLDNSYAVIDKQVFTNVVGISSVMDFEKGKDLSTSDNALALNGWFKDSTYVEKGDVYVVKWGVMAKDIDTVSIKPMYFGKNRLTSKYTQGNYNKVGKFVPKNLPTAGGIPYLLRFDVISNESRQKINRFPYHHINIAGFSKANITLCLTNKGPALMDTSYQVVNENIHFIEYGRKGLHPFCISETRVNYVDESDKNAFSKNAYFWWADLGGIIIGTNDIEYRPTEKYVNFEDAKWGYLDGEGNEVHRPDYDFVWPFDGSTGIVTVNSKKGAVNADTVIVPVEYSEVKYFEKAKDTLLMVRTIPRANYFLIDSLAEGVKTPYDIKPRIKAKQLEDLIGITNNSKHGFINRDGEVVIPTVLKRKPTVKDDYLIFKEKNYGILDWEGNELVAPEFKEIIYYKNDLVVFEKSNKKGVANSSGEIIILPQYQEIEIRNNSIYCESKFYSKVYDMEGNTLSHKKDAFSDLEEDKRIWLSVRKTTTKIISEDKSIKIKLKNQSQLVHFYKGFIKEKVGKDKFVLHHVSPDFKLVFDGNYEEIVAVNDSVFMVLDDKRYGLITTSNKLIMEVNYKYILEIYDGVFAGVRNNDVEVFDSNGKLLLELNGKNVFLSDNDMFLVQTDKGYCFYNRKMENAFHTEFEDAEPFAGDYAAISERGKWCVINKRGEELFEKSFSNIKPIASNIFYAQEQGYYGLYDLKGKVIAAPVYDKIVLIAPNLIQVIKQGLIGYIDCQGHWLYNPFN